MSRRKACYLAASNEVIEALNLDRLERHAADMRARRILEGSNGAILPEELERKVQMIQQNGFTVPEVQLVVRSEIG